MATNPQPQPLMTQVQAEEMLRLQRRADRRGGCLFAIAMSLLFGWFYWAWLALKWTAIGSWKLTVLSWRAAFALSRWSWSAGMVAGRWMWRGCVACWHWSVVGTQKAWPRIQVQARAFHARHGARGWAAVGGCVAALCVLGMIIGHH